MNTEELLKSKVKEYVEEALDCKPKADKRILQFITEFRLAGGLSETEEEAMRMAFRAGYCYYFAVMLKTAFPEGEICWTAPFGHIVFVYQNIPYDIEGLYYGEEDEELIPIGWLKDGILDFMHIPGKEYNMTDQEIAKIICEYREYKETKLAEDKARNAGYIKTDDYQFRKKLEDQVYHMIGVVEAKDDYIIYADTVDLHDYTDQEKKDMISTYGYTYHGFLEEFKGEQTQNDYLAEMFFETNFLSYMDAECQKHVEEEKDILPTMYEFVRV